MTWFPNMTGFLKSGFLMPWHKPAWLRPASLAIMTFAAVTAAGGHAGAAGARSERGEAFVDSRPAGPPIMAIISLQSQGVTVYDADGWIMRAPVSSGQRGRETPAGIFTVIEKQAEHYSNLYDDAFMPHMQRITWSGIALHGGPLPGYAASHGCIRLPYAFAKHLFETTKLGMRVIVAPTDVAPVAIVHPALLPSKPDAADAAATRAAQAADAALAADQAKLAAVTAARQAAREADRSAAPVRVAERLKAGAAARLKAAERALTSAHSPETLERAETAKAKAAADVAETDARFTAAQAEQQAKTEAAASARAASADAETRRAEAAEAARKAKREVEPGSVFISRKTQRLYVRQASQPVLESPVAIRDPDRPIGTHVFTALARIEGAADMRWSAVSLESGSSDVRATGPRSGNRDAESVPADPEAAKAALDRITIPADVLDRIAPMVSPRFSLIISDEALSEETSKGTEFVVIMSNEPQGGIKFRHHAPQGVARQERPFGEHPFGDQHVSRPLFRSPFGNSW
jgi:lipoprotein-anchoring transpeptidase ErfK/SrfK